MSNIVSDIMRAAIERDPAVRATVLEYAAEILMASGERGTLEPAEMLLVSGSSIRDESTRRAIDSGPAVRRAALEYVAELLDARGSADAALVLRQET